MQTVREIRCSSLDRYMKCPGFAQMTDTLPNLSNPAAEEGTAAGELLQAMLEQRSLKPNVSGVAKNGVRFDSDMYFHLSPIAQEILNKNVMISCEERIDWAPCPGIAIRGQFDIQYIIGDTLYIEDLKYGWKIVDVKENWQLLGYAIGCLIKLPNRPKYIQFTIHQPRPHHEDGRSRVWRIDLELLTGYYNMIQSQMTKIVSGSRELITGSHCKYCPAAANRCPAISHSMYDGIERVMYDFKQDDLTEVEIAEQLRLLEDVASLVKIKQDSLNDLACMKLKEGKSIPGYGLEEKFGDRSWKADVTPEAIECLTGLVIVEKVIMSPAKAEKLGVDKKLVKDLVERKFTGVKAVKKDFTKDAEKAFGKK
jgi:hypothetical protein